LHRHAGHWHRCTRGLAAAGQGDIEQSGGQARVVIEQLVEIPHPIEQQRVRVLRLDAQVLLHHWRVQRRIVRTRAGRRHLLI